MSLLRRSVTLEGEPYHEEQQLIEEKIRKNQEKSRQNVREDREKKQPPPPPEKKNMFEDVRKVFEEEKDVRKAVERLRQLGYNVEELRYEGELVGYRVGDVYIARRPSAWGKPESWMAAEIPDADVGYRWAVGYRFGSAWGDLSFVQRELEKKMRIKALDDWMFGLEQYGYKVRKVKWGPEAAVPGFTYIIEKDGRRVGEVSLAVIGDRLHLGKAGGTIPSVIDDPVAAARYLIYRHELGPHLERYGNIGEHSQQTFLIGLAAGKIDVEEAKLSILYLRCVKRVTKTVCVCRKNLSILYLRCFSEKRNPFTRCYHSFQFSI